MKVFGSLKATVYTTLLYVNSFTCLTVLPWHSTDGPSKHLPQNKTSNIQQNKALRTLKKAFKKLHSVSTV